MNSFVARHTKAIEGVLFGFDRVVFGGSLRSISYPQGVEGYLGARRIRYDGYTDHAQECTTAIVNGARRFAEEKGRPYRYVASSRDSKEALVDKIQAEGPVCEGLICILSCIESCRTFVIRRADQGWKFVLDERRCSALYFYFEDRDFGRMYVRIVTWFPFPIQIYINGRSYLARQLAREGIDFVRHDNCFTHIGDYERAQGILDQLTHRKWQATLDHFADLVNPLLAGCLADRRGYYWTLSQSEHATDVVFKSRDALARVYPGLVGYVMTHFGAKDVLRFLGKKLHPSLKTEVTTHRGQRADAVRLKHHVGRNTLKLYDKAQQVLRVETTINDPYDFRVSLSDEPEDEHGRRRRMRKGIADTRQRVQLAYAANLRYLEALAVVGNDTPSSDVLDPVTRPITRNGHRYRPLHPAEPKDARVLAFLLDGAHRLRGFTNRQLTAALDPRPATTPDEKRRRTARTTRLIGLLKAHGLIRKLPRQRRYQMTNRGINTATAAHTARRTPMTGALEANSA